MSDERSGPSGGPVPPWWTDPTENVKDLADQIKETVAAAMRRQDDLRNMQAEHAREMRETARMYEERLEQKNIRLDAKDELIRQGEARRIDAILKENASSVQRTAEVQAAQQQALAAQATATADAFRVSMANELAPIKSALAEVQRAQYEQQGQKQQVVESREVRAETRLNVNVVIGAIAGVVGFLILAVALYTALHK